ncbi:MAG: hypothetical protein AB1427_16360 [Thermodesulfobacteriota bacterium]
MEVGKFSQRSLFYFALFGVVILIIILLMVYPDYRTLSALDKDIKQLNVKIETQKLLLPLFQKMLTEIDLKLPEGVTLPKEEKLTQEKTEGIVSVFHDLAGKSGLKVVEASPDVESTLNGSGFLLMNIVVKGDFFKLRDFLMALGNLPYLEKIEQVKLQNIEEGKEVRLKIWLVKERQAEGK